MRAASLPASLTTSRVKPLAVSRPRALMMAASQDTVPKGRLPTRTLADAAATAPAMGQSAAVASNPRRDSMSIVSLEPDFESPDFGTGF